MVAGVVGLVEALIHSWFGLLPHTSPVFFHMASSSIYSTIKLVYRTKCDCGDRLQHLVSRTDKNPGRKFKACPNYKVKLRGFVFPFCYLSKVIKRRFCWQGSKKGCK
uniref:GRF-type domain-containing protein n=1 Tax=Lactuca sativa TaxID=4236 RepID=A0A9R1VZ72_LACSA|nr:hypothetical protein LSAT_V11C400198730 [Lactuca sativa]